MNFDGVSACEKAGEGHGEPWGERKKRVRIGCILNQRELAFPWRRDKEGGNGRRGAEGSKAPRSEVRQSSFSGIVELRSSSDFT